MFKNDGKVYVIEDGKVLENVQETARYLGASEELVLDMLNGNLGHKAYNGVHIEWYNSRKKIFKPVAVFNRGWAFRNIQEMSMILHTSYDRISKALKSDGIFNGYEIGYISRNDYYHYITNPEDMFEDIYKCNEYILK